MAETLKNRLIQGLIKSLHIKQKDIDEAMARQQNLGVSFEKALLDKGLINEEDLLVLLVKELHIPFINLKKYKVDPSLFEEVPERIARQYHIVPISRLKNTITVAISDPLNIFAVDDIKNVTGKEIDVVMCTDTDVLEAIDNYYSSAGSHTVQDVAKDLVDENFEIVREEQAVSDEESGFNQGEQAPIIRLVNLIIQEAIRQRASDVHIEPMADIVRVRYRIDGVLQEGMVFPKQNQNAVLVRIKIMSRMDITVTRVPQDGRFKMKVAGQEVDFRISFLPTVFGQKVVMRVLDKQNLKIGLAGLGFSSQSLEIMKSGIQQPFGMILVTGPTGSGKSTTLYSVVNELNTVDRNIITAEDPVEYQMEGLTQIQVRPEIGLTFASGLRAILRQSPDIVMVGEIRDFETADIAIKASLTGQLVLSTLHTNDAPGALTRLVDMGVEAFLVASSLVLVCAQRLCRKVCPHCKKKVDIPSKVFDDLNIKAPEDAVFVEGKGCDHCRQTGYYGRLGITEILEVDDTVRELLIRGKSSDEIGEYAHKEKGMRLLYDDILERFFKGETTLSEVLRITSND